MYYKIILVLSIFCWAANAQTTAKKCAEVDEYCQNHWECCSGSCLSFSYKCVRSNRPPDMSNRPIASQGSTVDLGNRFGAAGQATGSTTCARAGQYCQSASDCCSQSCLSFSYKCIGDGIAAGPQYPLFVQGSGTVDLGNRFGETTFHPSPIFGEQQPSVVNSIDDLISSLNFNQGGNVAVVPVASNIQTQTQNRFGGEIGSSNKNCLEIGNRCFRHDECCSGRCHGFLHQCVT